MTRHVFWDLGGTLVDSYPQVDKAFCDVVRVSGHDVDLIDVSRLTRVSTTTAITTLAERFGIDPADFERANADLKRIWETRPAPAMPGAIRLMVDLHAAGGLNLVVTHRDRSSAESLIKGLGLPVDDLLSTSDGFPRKPDPSMYDALIARHRLTSDECMGVGDRPLDVEAAHRAGMSAAILGDPALPVESDADFEIGLLDDLRPMLRL